MMLRGSAERGFPKRLTHGEQRDLRTLRALDRADGVRIKHGLAVNEKQVTVVAVMEWNLNEPAAARLPHHRMRRGIPFIEVTSDENRFGFERLIEEGNWLGHLLGRVAAWRKQRI